MPLFFDDGYIATGKFVSLKDRYFTFNNEGNQGLPVSNRSDTACRHEDHPYCMVKRIQRDFFGPDKGYGE